MKSRLGYVTVPTLLVAFASCGGGSTPTVATAPLIITASLPNGTLETPYSQTIQASGGVAPFRWTVSAGALPSKIALSPSVTNTVTLSGTPDTAVQALAFTVQITDSANRSAVQPYTVSILLEPDTLTLSPPSLSFAPQLVGTLSAAEPEMVTNTGSIPVLINGVALAGTNAADFGQNNNCGSSLAAGANCVINVSVTPGQLGPSSASITITDSTVGSPHSVALSGVGLTSGPNATLSATTLAFGNQVVGTSSPAQSITLSNYGTTTLSITGITASSNFGQTNTCISTLASGASCTVSVTFTPGNTGSLNGTLSCADSAADSPQTVALSGTGVAQPHSGRCLVGSGNTLTGYCIGTRGGVCRQAYDPTNCPVGQPPTGVTSDQCGISGTFNVDASRSCSP